jgi:hypothetical protein
LADTFVKRAGLVPALKVTSGRLAGFGIVSSDLPPGNAVIWRGLSRLTDKQLGIMIGVEPVGN